MPPDDEQHDPASIQTVSSLDLALTRRGALALAGIAGGMIASLTVPAPSAKAAGEPVWGHPLVSRGVVSSGFRRPSRPSHDGIDFHNGFDGARNGDSIRAIADGYVRSAGWSGNYGNLVVVDHGGGWVSHYAHAQSGSLVAANTNVSRGAHLAQIGNTGRSFGAHLHLEILFNRNFVDPEPRVANAPLPGQSPQPVPNEWDVMATKQEIQSALAEIIAQRSPGLGTQLWLYTPSNDLLLVDHVNMTIRNLGHTSNTERDRFAAMPYQEIGEPAWTQRFANFSYITSPNIG